MALIDEYKDLITSQHRDKPKYMAALSALLKHSEDIFGLGVYLDDDFDLDNAVGKQEDVLGEIVGQSRILDFDPATQPTPILDNETYRLLLRSKIAKNLWKGGIEDLETIWETLFGERIRIIDNQDMTMDVEMVNLPPSIILELIFHRKIVPKPQSVWVNYHVIDKMERQFFVGILPTYHKHHVVSPRKPKDGDINAIFYMGNNQAIHKRHIVTPRKITAASVNVKPYAGNAATYHKKYVI